MLIPRRLRILKFCSEGQQPLLPCSPTCFPNILFRFLFRLLLELFWKWTIFCFFKFFLFERMLLWSGGSVCLLFSIKSSCSWNCTVRRGSLFSTCPPSFLGLLELRDADETEEESRLTPGPYTDILGCSISKSSIGLASKTSGKSPLASKQGGGVTYQLSSSCTWAFSLESSFSFPAAKQNEQ